MHNSSGGAAGQPNPQIQVQKQTADEYRAVDCNDSRFFIVGRVAQNGLSFRIRVRDLKTNEKSSIAAKEFFDAMMQALEPGDPPFYAIVGDWDVSDPDYASNLWKFNDLISKGSSRDDAAKGAFTGQLAKDWGYTDTQWGSLSPLGAVKHFTSAKVRFINPKK